MASVNSTVYGNQIGAGASPVYPAAKLANGKLRFARIETTVASLGATNDTFNLIRLKKGAVVIPGLSKTICENPGTTVTGTIGDAGVADRYSAAQALGGGAKDVFWSATPGVAAYVGYEIAEGNEVLVWTSTSIASATAASKVVFLIAYIDE